MEHLKGLLFVGIGLLIFLGVMVFVFQEDQQSQESETATTTLSADDRLYVDISKHLYNSCFQAGGKLGWSDDEGVCAGTECWKATCIRGGEGNVEATLNL